MTPKSCSAAVDSVKDPQERSSGTTEPSTLGAWAAPRLIRYGRMVDIVGVHSVGHKKDFGAGDGYAADLFDG